MSSHNFNKSLSKEQHSSKLADEFYVNNKFQAQIVERYNLNTQEHLIVQRKDIDVKLLLANGKEVVVSEKFRAYDYNDLLLEIYSKYPDTKGWMHQSEADRLAYFFPKRMFWIDKKALQSFCLDLLFPKIVEESIQNLLSQERDSAKIQVHINDLNYGCILTQAKNNTDGDTWNTISVSVPFKMLDDFKVRYQVFTF